MQTAIHRTMKAVADREAIAYLIQKHLNNRPMFFKHDPEIGPVHIQSAGDSGDSSILLTCKDPCAIHTPEEPVLFRVLGRYVEVNLKIQEQINAFTAKATVLNAAIASVPRSSRRVSVSSKVAKIQSLRITKNRLDHTVDEVPTFVRIHLSLFSESVSHIGDSVDFIYHSRDDELSPYVRNGKKPLVIPDTAEARDLYVLGQGPLDLPGDDRLKVQKYARRLRDRGFRSQLMVPIGYPDLESTESLIPGFLRIRFKELREDFDQDHQKVSEQIPRLIRNIGDSNTEMISEPAELADVSRGGFKFRSRSFRLDRAIQQYPEFYVVMKILDRTVQLKCVLRSYKQRESGFSAGVQILEDWNSPEELALYRTAVDRLLD